MRQHSKARTGVTIAVSAVLASGGLLALASPVQAAPAVTTGSGEVIVNDASFVWGVSGYAQDGIFGPWRFKDNTGNASFLTGSVVSGGSQTEYVVAPIPATSMPVSTPQKTANAVKFTDGTGRIDPATGAGKLTFDGSYTINAYPAMYNAPDEVYTDPELTVAADGSGTLTAEFEIGAGADMSGNPLPPEDFGRLKIATFDAGSLTNKTASGYRLTPDYQGVDSGVAGQNKTCTTAGGGTGWWGSWPVEFIDAVKASTGGASVLPHFYSTGCGGKQDNKPQLPIDVTFDADLPQVSVSETAFNIDGSATITVEGANFTPALAEATRAPICASGPPAPCGKAGGTYVAVGKFAANWRPSAGVASSARKAVSAANGGQKWAVPAESLTSIGGEAGGGIVLAADGSFTAELTVDKADIDSLTGLDSTHVNYGIYTYPGSGSTAAAYETYTPITFGQQASTTTVSGLPTTATFGTELTADITVAGAGSTPTGTVEAFDGTTPIGEGTLVDGAASIALPDDISVGSHELTFVYSGDANYLTSTTSALQLEITAVVPPKVTSAPAVSAPTSVYGKNAVVVVTIPTVAGKVPTGTVTLTGAGTQTKKLSGGKTWFSLAANVPAGKRNLTISYTGDSNYNASTKVQALTVNKNSVTISDKVTKKPTTKKSGKIKVTVKAKSSNLKPTGKVKVVFKKSGQKSVSTSTSSLKNGVKTLSVKKLKKKGTWKVYVTYYAGPGYNSVSSKYVGTAKVTK